MFFRLLLLGISLALVILIFDVIIPKIKLKYKGELNGFIKGKYT